MARGAGGEKAAAAKKARWVPTQQAAQAAQAAPASQASPQKAAGPTRRARGQKGGDAETPSGDAEGEARTEERGVKDYMGDFKFGKILESKAYKDAVLEVLQNTCAKEKDFDTNVIGLLDQLHNLRKSQEACNILRATLEGMGRDHINNWKGYIYCLLKKVDEKAYAAWTEKKPVRRDTKGGKKHDDEEEEDGEAAAATPWFPNPNAAAFVPGQPWTANPSAKEFVPGQTWLEDPTPDAPQHDAGQSPAEDPKPTP